MSHSLRVVVVTDCPLAEAFYRDLLPRLGHEPHAARVCPSVALVCGALRPRVVVVDLPSFTPGEATDVAVELAWLLPVPVVPVADRLDPALRRWTEEGLFPACIVRPVTPAALETALFLAASRPAHSAR